MKYLIFAISFNLFAMQQPVINSNYKYMEFVVKNLKFATVNIPIKKRKSIVAQLIKEQKKQELDRADLIPVSKKS